MAKPIEQLMEVVVEKDASDLHLHVNRSPLMRLNNRFFKLDNETLTSSDTLEYARKLTPEDHWKDVEKSGGTDFGYSFNTKGRFRISVYREKEGICVAMRLIPYKLLSFEELGLSKCVRDLCLRPRGLFLVTGPTGCGKTTTLATLINYINENKECHIITIEDPIEYYHSHKKAIITQREVGRDVPTFAEAIRRGLRQDPDVFLVGEMRDLETIHSAIMAAETGHLVFGTLHTTGAARTVDRIVDSFPVDQQEEIRILLSASLEAVLSQLLFRRQDKEGRVAAFEIMVATPAIRNLIREKKTYRVLSEMQTGVKYGMETMDQSLLKLYKKGVIAYEDALEFAYDPDNLRMQAGESK